MSSAFQRRALLLSACALVVASDALNTWTAAGGSQPAAVQTNPEKEAYEAAKELGTAEGWNAFLKSYANGFHADLARAYLNKLSGSATAPTPPSSPALQPTNSGVLPSTTSSGGGYEIGCANQGKIASRESTTPTKITFLNRSGMDRAIQWIDFNGGLKNYANLDPGQDVTLDTFVTHPWMITDGPGNCIHIVMPANGPTQVSLGAAIPSYKAQSNTAPARVERKPEKKVATTKKRKITCSAGKTWNGAQCVDKAYVDKQGKPRDGYYSDDAGNIYQDNGGGE